MSTVLESLVLSFMLSISCKVYFETILEKRIWKHRWVSGTMLPAFTFAFIIIAFSEIPPYIIQPLRTIAVICLIVQIYFQLRLSQNIVLSVLFCAFLWITSALVQAALEVLPAKYAILCRFDDELWNSLLLVIVLLFRRKYKRQKSVWTVTNWMRFGYFPAFSIAAIVVFNGFSWNTGFPDYNIQLIAIASFSVISIFAFYFIGNILEKEAEVHKMKLMQERSQNQVDMYRNMQYSYRQQARRMHDYKNQLNCIQGLLDNGSTEEASAYIQKLTGNLNRSMDLINTKHAVVNVIVNQKYRYAMEKGITMVISVNDLSRLTMSEEDIVTLLVNLLDNAVEACEKLSGSKIIQFKMELEDEQLILSIRNPTGTPVTIKDKIAATTKKDKCLHGIGLMNVDSVMKKNHGTSVLKCTDGFFYFSAIIPQ